MLTSLIIASYIVIHIGLIIPSYLLVRNDLKKTKTNWTNGDMLAWLIMAIAFSPILFLVAIVIYFAAWFKKLNFDYLNKPSNF